MSFGMGKRLKHLKIRGQLLRTGEPEVDDPDVRVYRAVTLTDDDAGEQEVHFRVMLIPRRLEDRLQANGWQGTFYVLRHLDAQGLVGALYAAEANGQKAYEPTGSWKALKSMATVSSRRLQVVASNPAVLTSSSWPASCQSGCSAHCCCPAACPCWGRWQRLACTATG